MIGGLDHQREMVFKVNVWGGGVLEGPRERGSMVLDVVKIQWRGASGVLWHRGQGFWDPEGPRVRDSMV